MIVPSLGDPTWQAQCRGDVSIQGTEVRCQANPSLFFLSILLAFLWSVQPSLVHATVGWEVGDMVLDFGLDLEPGEQAVLVDSDEIGHPFFVELTWKLNPDHCLLQIEESAGDDDEILPKRVIDDGLFNGVVSHAVYPEVRAVLVRAAKGEDL